MENFVSITELFIKALQKDSSYIEYPCELKPREYGSSKMNIFSNIFSFKFYIQTKTKKIKLTRTLFF